MFGPMKRFCVDHRKNIGQQFNAAVQGPAEQLFLGDDQAMHFEGIGGCAQQVILAARFEQKAKNVSFIDHAHGVLQVGVAGQHHANGVGREFPDAGKKFNAIHAGHLAVGKHDGKR